MPIRTAVLIPCLNERMTVAKVIGDFQAVLPDAAIYVIDNASTDDTAAIGRSAGATVISEPRRGKGYAMRTAFRRVEADIYVMVDGDDTYPADEAPKLMAPVLENLATWSSGHGSSAAPAASSTR